MTNDQKPIFKMKNTEKETPPILKDEDIKSLQDLLRDQPDMCTCC